MRRLPRMRFAFAVSLLLALCSPAAAFWSSDPSVNTPVCTVTSNQSSPQMTPDGSGGVFVVWWESRNGTIDGFDVWGQHFDALGRPLWAANGLLLVGGPDIQGAPQVVSDGLGGMLMVYAFAPTASGGATLALRAQRFDASGVRQWAPSGISLLSVQRMVQNIEMATDGEGGLVVVWNDDRTPGNLDLFMQRVTSDGSVSWLADGVRLTSGTGAERNPRLVPAGASGTYVVWEDARNGDQDIYLEHVSPTASTRYGLGGNPVCTATGDQNQISAVSDGQQGVIVAWSDGRVAANDLYAQKFSPAGPQWTPNGTNVIAQTGFQSAPSLVPDGDGGAFVTWHDTRTSTLAVYAQRISRFGFRMWAVDGMPVCVGIGAQQAQSVTDGSGGLFTVWEDFRTPSQGLFAQRLDANGLPKWALNGVAITTAPDYQAYAKLVSNEPGSAIVVWEDFRADGVQNDLYAERIEKFGFIGVPEPVIASALDVPNDQGGRVKVSWYGSWPELPPTDAIDYYNLFRSVPTSLVAAEAAAGRRVVGPEEGCESGDCFMALTAEGTTTFWEFVAQQGAFELDAYSYLVPTTGDSVGGSNPLTEFMVQARSNSGPQFWNSPTVSGYSVDDLAPATPAPFTGVYSGGTTSLIWGANTEADLAGYELHRGSTAGFVPTPANRVVSTPETDHVDAFGVPAYYKLAALDAHGNRSGYALVVPEGALDAGDAVLPREVALSRVAPNPSRGTTTFRFALPARARAELAVFDAQGRLVEELVRTEFDAGEHAVTWLAQDTAGRPIAAGLYLVRLRAAGREISERFVRVE